MADDEVATKAPESDAQEATTTNTSESSGATMSEHCTTDRPLPSSTATVKGEVSTINGISCYVSKPSEYPHSPCKLLFFLTNGTGILSTNNQLQADMYADRGYVVVMPDQFSGDSAPRAAHTVTPSSSKDDPTSPTSNPTFLERIKAGTAEVAKSFMIDMWLAKHTPTKVLPILQKALEGAKEEFADSVANGGGIYGVGYCFGGKYILLLCGQQGDSMKQGEETAGAESSKKPELKAGVIAHGSLITQEDLEGVKSPIAMACVENDPMFSDAIREHGRASLELNGVDHEIKIFSDVPHGFAVLGDYKDETIKQKQTEAFDMMIGWLDAH